MPIEVSWYVGELHLVFLASVVEVCIFTNINPISLPRYRFKKSRTPRARRSQHHQHLTILHNTIKVSDDINPRLSIAHQLSRPRRNLQPNVSHVLLEVCSLAVAKHIEILVANASLAVCEACFAVHLGDGLCPRQGSEFAASWVERAVFVGGEGVATDGG
jgi:hypothetical protein